MTKKEYIKKQISRTNKKDYENYVITGIIHKLNNLDVKFITQQYVKRPTGKGFMDLYFPQINYCVEIDEWHHLNQQEADKLRDRDFINITNCEIKRINVSESPIDQVNKQIDETVDAIKSRITRLGPAFIPWDVEREFDSDHWIKKGYIDISDDCTFRTMVDAANCFGKQYAKNGIWKGGVNHSEETGKLIWFPKLYANKDWDNSISVDETKIIEKSNNQEMKEPHIQWVLEKGPHRRIIFARVAGIFGFVFYRYKGEYELDIEESNNEYGLIWKRITTQSKTYPRAELKTENT